NTHNLAPSPWPYPSVSASRVFQVDPGTKQVTVRYRFQTVERTGYFTTPHNDWFDVKVRSLTSGNAVEDVSDVFTLWSQLDNNGATAWRTLTLAVQADGESI